MQDDKMLEYEPPKAQLSRRVSPRWPVAGAVAGFLVGSIMVQIGFWANPIFFPNGGYRTADDLLLLVTPVMMIVSAILAFRIAKSR